MFIDTNGASAPKLAIRASVSLKSGHQSRPSRHRAHFPLNNTTQVINKSFYIV